jgi:hypothetical protein
MVLTGPRATAERPAHPQGDEPTMGSGSACGLAKVQWPRAPTRAMSLRTDSIGGIS